MPVEKLNQKKLLRHRFLIDMTKETSNYLSMKTKYNKAANISNRKLPFTQTSKNKLN